MNVQELIEKLQSFPPECLVLISAYEGGVTARYKVRESLVVSNQPYVPGINGEFTEAYYDEDGYLRPLDSEGHQQAIVLSFREENCG